MERHGLIFITGGVRSGKSTFAEQYATTCAEQSFANLIYVATSRVEDKEMEKRITKHRNQRLASGYHWNTIECPVGLASIGGNIREHDIVLLDCLTVLLTNELFSSETKEDDWQSLSHQQKVMKRIETGIDTLRGQAQLVIIVSNEVLHESIPDEGLVHTYSKILGKLHQSIVRKADEAYLLEAGIPIQMKGAIST